MLERLRKLRIAKGFTCKQMADRLGLTKGTYSKKERGQIGLTLLDAHKIATIFDSSIDDIFFSNSCKRS